MSTDYKTKQEQFYLTSVDILQGISIVFVVIWHTLYWRYSTLYSKWPDITFAVAAFMTIAMLVPPCFFFTYGFNVVNSLLRKKEELERRETRSRYLKRTMIFFLIAEFGEGSTALVTSPENFLNFLLTWELFHMFALSTLFFLLVFEFAWKMETYGFWNHKRVSAAILTLFFTIIITLFLLFHNYENREAFNSMYIELNIDSFLQRVLFEEGQNPVVPWLSLPIIGGIIAIFLDLPHEQRNVVLKKAGVVIIAGILIFTTGILFLGIERYCSTQVLLPASSSFILIAIGTLLLLTTCLILLFDLNLFDSHQIVNKFLLPISLVSKITLTIFFVQNLAFILPPESQLIVTIIPSETVALIAGILYSLFFILIALIWQKRDFKYSFEWMILKLQETQWRWWIKTQV